jgi:WD40 repeat protein/cell division protein FtsB
MNVRDSIVAVLNEKGSIVGTGFLVGENLVATCAHVVVIAWAIDGDTIQVRFEGKDEKLNAFVMPEYWRDIDKGDVAILQLETVPDDVSTLPLAPAAGSAGHDFYAYGYATVAEVQGIGARGKIVDIVDNGRMVQLEATQPDRGMSGGPVLDEQRRVVIGMVTKGKGFVGEDKSIRNVFTTFATSTEVIFKACSVLKPTEICPYRSLDVFNEEDAPFFFGRDKVVKKLLDSLKREPRFLAVLGPSGSGKSSVIRAGLIPALRQGKVPGSQNWDIVTIRPANDPFEQLAGAGFLNPEAGLENSVKAWLAERSDKTRLMLFIDQFEEVLVSTPKDIRQKFIVELAQLLDAPLAITVVLSLRDDFYSQFQKDAALLNEWKSRGQIDIPQIIEQEDLQAMIVKPAHSVGLTFDEGLVDVIIEDACETDRSSGLARSTVLPLLEFALTRLWSDRKDGRLTHDVYKKIGGTTGSLSLWADKIYYELSPNERKLVEQVFCGLVHLGDEKEQIPDTRRVIPLNTLSKGRAKGDVETIIGKMVQARLLSTYTDYNNEAQFVEIIHDALLKEWGLLAQWINDFRHREQRAKERRRRMTIVGLLLGLILMMILALLAWMARNEAEQQRVIAQTNEVIAQQQAEIAFSRQLAAQAETINATRSSQQLVAVLLAIRSMQINPSSQAAKILLNSTAAKTVFRTAHEGVVRCVAVDGNGERIASGGGNAILIQDIFSGDIIHRLLHEDLVYTISFSPDGTLLASGSRDMTIRIWDTVSGEEIRKNNQDGVVNSVAFSPDGRYVAAGSEQTISVWKVDTGTEVARMSVHTGPINKVVFSNDGNYLVSADTITARVWDIATSEEISRVKHDSMVRSVAISPDGSYVVSGGDDFRVRIWETETGRLMAYSQHIGAVMGIDISPDGAYIATASRDNTARIWDAKTGGEIIRMTHDGSVFFVSFSHDGKFAVSGGSDKTARIWDALYGVEYGRMTHSSQVYSAAFSPDGVHVVSGGDDNLVRVWKTITGAEISRVTHDGRVYVGRFSPDGNYVATGGSDNLAHVWDISTNTEVFQSQHDGPVHSLEFSQDGKRFLVGAGTILRVIDVATWKEKQKMIHDDEIYAVAFSPDRRYVISGGKDNTARVWDIESGEEISRVNHDGRVTAVSFSPDGNYVISAGHDSSVRVWEPMTGAEINRFLHEGQVYSAAINSQGTHIVSGDEKYAYAWDVITGAEVARVLHSAFVYSVSFSPDDKHVVSGGWHNLILWDYLSGEEIRRIKHDGVINTVAFSPDGKYLVSGDDKAAYVWDALTGEEIVRMFHNNLVKSVSFSPDGKYVVSAGVDRTARVWLWHPDDLITNTCTTLTRNLLVDEWNLYFGEEPYQTICSNLPTQAQPMPAP